MATFTNSAQLTYAGKSVLSNTVSGEITEVLSVTKTAVTSEYAANDTVTYVVTLTNSGSTALTGITLTDDLGAYAFGEQTLVPLDYTDGSVKAFTNGVPAAAPTVTAADPLTLTGISVPAGGNVVLVYETATNEFTPIGVTGSVTNTVTATSADLVDPVTASETVTAVSEAVLQILKSLSPQTVVTSGAVTYTFTVENSGTAAAPADVVITDTFSPVLSALTVTFNGTEWTEGAEYTYDEITGVFQTNATYIPVPAATVSQDPQSGRFTVTNGIATLTVTGTI